MKQPVGDWYEVIKRVAPGLRILGIISMDEWNPPTYWARMFVLDEDYYINGDGSFGTFGYSDKIPKYIKELRAVRSWSDSADTHYFDAALDHYYYYANDYDNGSPTMEEALKHLKRGMKELAKEFVE